MMLDDEAIMIGGLLVGLNIIDCTFSIKDEDLDQPVSTCLMTFFTLQPSQILNPSLSCISLSVPD